jgi:hypothetical protein
VKQLTININNDDFDRLQAAQYNLCIAKKIADEDYDVVWWAIPYSEYIPVTTIAWPSSYQLFLALGFQPGNPVAQSGPPVDVFPGQQVTLDASGQFSTPSVGSSPKSITLINQYGSIFPAVSQPLTVGQGAIQPSPFFIPQAMLLKGQIDFAPTDTVLVWFQQRATSGMMFSPPPSQEPQEEMIARTTAFEVDLSSGASASITYSNQEWKPV